MKPKIVNKPDEKTEDDITYGPIQAFLVTLGSFFTAQFLVSAVFTLIVLIFQIERVRAEELLRLPLVQFVGIVLTSAVMLWIINYYLKFKKVHWNTLSLVNPKLTDAGPGAFAFGVYLAITSVIIYLVPVLLPGIDVNQTQELGFKPADTSGFDLILAFFSLAIIPPIVEEVVFRGFLYSGIRKNLNFIIAAIITSVIFAIGHLQLGFGNGPLWIAAIDTFTLSMILVYLRERLNTIWPGVFVHFIKNSLAFLLLFIFPTV